VSWLEWGTLFALLCGLVLMVETFRAEPMWLYIRCDRPGPSPVQRRLMGAGIASAMAGQFASLQREGDTVLWVLEFALIAAGVVCMLIAAFRGPTRSERQRRASVLGADHPGAP
jgi:hypothetical protein